MNLIDAAVLAFEERRYQHPGAKEEAITVELRMTPVRYAQRLNALLDDPKALQTAPVLVNRLRRLRESRAGARRGVG